MPARTLTPAPVEMIDSDAMYWLLSSRLAPRAGALWIDQNGDERDGLTVGPAHQHADDLTWSVVAVPCGPYWNVRTYRNGLPLGRSEIPHNQAEHVIAAVVLALLERRAS